MDWFGAYVRVFTTVEINNTFYRMPGPPVFKKWREQAPAGFIYAVKASRFITHMKKLRDAKGPATEFVRRASLLGPVLGPVLFQLPPRWSVNTARLETFTRDLPEGPQYVFEFRDASWHTREVFDMLEARGMSLCLHDMEGAGAPDEPVGPLCYVRFHGTAGRYGGRYPAAVLRKRARMMREAVAAGKPVYAYFNNDAEGAAPADAAALIETIEAGG